jgi:hypothetical protein
MINEKVSAKEDEQPRWARIFLNVNIANGTLESVCVEQRRMVFDEFIVPSMTEADSTVKVTMQENGEFVFHWESAADKDAFILNWNEGEELQM